MHSIPTCSPHYNRNHHLIYYIPVSKYSSGGSHYLHLNTKNTGTLIWINEIHVITICKLLSLYNIFENSSSVANSWKTKRPQLSDFSASHFKRHYGLKSDVVDCIHWSCNKLRMKKAKHCLLQRGNFLLTVQQLIICIMPWLEV